LPEIPILPGLGVVGAFLGLCVLFVRFYVKRVDKDNDEIRKDRDYYRSAFFTNLGITARIVDVADKLVNGTPREDGHEVVTEREAHHQT
jgi:hypothetical protein